MLYSPRLRIDCGRASLRQMRLRGGASQQRSRHVLEFPMLLTEYEQARQALRLVRGCGRGVKLVR